MRTLMILALFCAPLLYAQDDPVVGPAPKPGQAEFKDGEDAFTEGRMQEAVVAFTKALTAQPKNDEALGYRAAAFVALGKLDEAWSDVEAAVKLSTNFSLAWNTRGYIRWLRKDLNAAIEDYTAAIAYGTDDRRIDDAGRAQMFQNRGIAYQDAGNTDRALLDFNSCIDLQPKNPAFFENRGLIFVDKQLFDIAFKDFDRALELDPKNARAYVNRASAARLMGDYEQAVRDCSQALRLKENYAQALIGRAYTWFGWNRPELARNDFAAASKVEGFAAAGEVGLGDLDLAKGELAAAEKHFKLAVSLDPNNLGARAGLARTYLQQQDFENASVTAATLCAMQPGEARYWSLLSDARMGSGSWEEALVALNRTLDLVPDDAGTHARRLRCYAKLKMFKAANGDAQWLLERDFGKGLVESARVHAIENGAGSLNGIVNSLTQAKAAGEDLSALADDPDFAAFKKDPKFKALVGK